MVLLKILTTPEFITFEIEDMNMITLPEELTFKTYKKFLTFNLSEVVDNWSDQQIEEWDALYKDTIKYNDDITRYNSTIEKNWIEIFNSNNAKIKNAKGSRLGWYKEFVNAIGKPNYMYIPSITTQSIKIGEKYYSSNDLVNISPTTLKEVVNVVRIKFLQYSKTKCKETELTLKLMKLAEDYHVSVYSYENINEFFSAIKEEHKNRWILENYPDGTELDLDCCDECGTWIVGEHRCSCGNRRVYLEVEGNVLDGYIAYPYCH